MITEQTQNRFNFKIFNKSNKKYIGNSSKKVWHRSYAVADFLKVLSRRGFQLSDLEVHKFPIESAEVVDANVFVDKETQRLIENKQKEIKTANEVDKKYIQQRIIKLEKEIERIKSKI